jgi:hypothetical protein
MEHLIRSAKPGSDWTSNELLAFNQHRGGRHQYYGATFFGNPELPKPFISPRILNNLHEPDGALLDDERDFLLHLSSGEWIRKSAVDALLLSFSV